MSTYCFALVKRPLTQGRHWMHSHGAFLVFKFPSLRDRRVIDSVRFLDSAGGFASGAVLELLDGGAYKTGV